MRPRSGGVVQRVVCGNTGVFIGRVREGRVVIVTADGSAGDVEVDRCADGCVPWEWCSNRSFRCL